MPRLAPSTSAPLLDWDAARQVEALRLQRADLLRRLARCHRWRSERHRLLLAELADVTGQLITVEIQLDSARRDRLLMRD